MFGSRETGPLATLDVSKASSVSLNSSNRMVLAAGEENERNGHKGRERRRNKARKAKARQHQMSEMQAQAEKEVNEAPEASRLSHDHQDADEEDLVELNERVLGKSCLDKLNKALNEEFSVYPSSYCVKSRSLPVLRVVVGDLLRYLLSNLNRNAAAEDAISVSSDSSGESVEESSQAAVTAEIYGGVAHAIVAQEVAAGPARPPTDFDVRFNIGNMDFDRCRDFVERYLLDRLVETVSEDSSLRKADESLIRFSYFQKQVVVGSSFSLLSVGSDRTGRNIDLEFSSGQGEIRNYFDDANAFVIPLPVELLEGQSETVLARCLSGSFSNALALVKSRELVIHDPQAVMNGLALYTHAICEKHLTPRSVEDEAHYAQELAGSFLNQARDQWQKGGDPLRFLRSFMKSHYSGRALSKLAMSVQYTSLLLAYGSLKQSDYDLLIPGLSDIISESFVAALQESAGSLKGLEVILAIARFLPYPAGVTDSTAEQRSTLLSCRDGRFIRLLRIPCECPNCFLIAYRVAFGLRQKQSMIAPMMQRATACGLPALIHMLETMPNLIRDRGSMPQEAFVQPQVPSQAILPLPSPEQDRGQPISMRKSQRWDDRREFGRARRQQIHVASSVESSSTECTEDDWSSATSCSSRSQSPTPSLSTTDNEDRTEGWISIQISDTNNAWSRPLQHSKGAESCDLDDPPVIVTADDLN